MIWVCPLSRLQNTMELSGGGRLISLLSVGASMERPPGIAAENHLLLTMHDIVEEREGYVAPALHHAAALLDFAQRWGRASPLIIHCFAGISRSPAAAYIIAAALMPTHCELNLANTLRELAPSATPNIRLISLADQLLGRGGRMTAAIKSIGRGRDAYEGEVFSFPLI